MEILCKSFVQLCKVFVSASDTHEVVFNGSTLICNSVSLHNHQVTGNSCILFSFQFPVLLQLHVHVVKGFDYVTIAKVQVQVHMHVLISLVYYHLFNEP